MKVFLLTYYYSQGQTSSILKSRILYGDNSSSRIRCNVLLGAILEPTVILMLLCKLEKADVSGVSSTTVVTSGIKAKFIARVPLFYLQVETLVRLKLF